MMSRTSERSAHRERLLLTGAAGFLGTALTTRLLATERYEITALDIRPRPFPSDGAGARTGTLLRTVVGDVRDERLVSSLMAQTDTVVHAAAALPSYTPADIRSVDVDGTGRLLAAAERAGVSRFVHLSSTAVYGLPRETPTPESHPLCSVDPYNTAKIAAEETCRRYRAHGMCVPILRPKTFIGPGRLGVFAMLFDWALDGRNFPVLGSGRHRNQMLEVADLVDAVCAVLELPAAEVDREFNIGAVHYAGFRDDCSAVLEAAGHGRRVVSLPARPATAVLRALAAVRLSPVYPRLLHKLTRDSCVDTSLASDVLGFSPRHSSTDALLRSFDWYRTHRDRVSGSSGRTHSEKWREGALHLARALF